MFRHLHPPRPAHLALDRSNCLGLPGHSSTSSRGLRWCNDTHLQCWRRRRAGQRGGSGRHRLGHRQGGEIRRPQSREAIGHNRKLVPIAQPQRHVLCRRRRGLGKHIPLAWQPVDRQCHRRPSGLCVQRHRRRKTDKLLKNCHLCGTSRGVVGENTASRRLLNGGLRDGTLHDGIHLHAIRGGAASQTGRQEKKYRPAVNPMFKHRQRKRHGTDGVNHHQHRWHGSAQKKEQVHPLEVNGTPISPQKRTARFVATDGAL